MTILRASGVALFVSSIAALAWAVSVGGCSSSPVLFDPNCFVPSVGAHGADGGPDPCHCNEPPPYAGDSCPCTSTAIFPGTEETGQEVFTQCMALIPADAGAVDDAAEGGPLAAYSPPPCDGACWPPPPHDWITPLLLWTGNEADAPTQCPPVAEWGYYNGSMGDTFALGCIGDQTGACSPAGEVCGPPYLGGWSQCVVRDGVTPCPFGGPMGEVYTVQYIFYEQPSEPSTFCCLPLSTPG